MTKGKDWKWILKIKKPLTLDEHTSKKFTGKGRAETVNGSFRGFYEGKNPSLLRNLGSNENSLSRRVV